MPDELPVVIVRWPRPRDEEHPFEAAGGLKGRLDFGAVIRRHDPPSGRFVWIAECNGEIVGMANGALEDDAVHIEHLARNSASRAAKGQRVGQALLDAVDALAWALGAPGVTLESLDDLALLAFYEDAGFVRDGPPLFDASWGTLHPMRRPPSSGPP